MIQQPVLQALPRTGTEPDASFHLALTGIGAGSLRSPAKAPSVGLLNNWYWRHVCPLGHPAECSGGVSVLWVTLQMFIGTGGSASHPKPLNWGLLADLSAASGLQVSLSAGLLTQISDAEISVASEFQVPHCC